MPKTSLDKKAATKVIIDSRENGKTDQEIYTELAQQYYDKKVIALLITSIATKADKAKYKIYNYILLGLLGLTALLKIFAIQIMTLQEGQLWLLLLVFIVPILNIYFIYEVSRYNAPAYRLCGIMSILGITQSLSNIQNSTDLFLTLLLCGAIAGLSFFIDSALFPNYSPRNLNKDSNGEYIL